MTFNFHKYYKEIKNRLILTSIAWVFNLSICYLYKETILFTLISLNYSFNELNIKPYFIFTEVTEIFTVYLNLCLFITNQVGIFLLVYHTFTFLSLGLYKFEFLKIKFALQVFLISWVFSTLLLHNLVIPFSWNFFLSFQENSIAIQPFSLFFETKLLEYFHYFTNLYYICLICCQFLGILTIFLTSLNEQFKQTRIFRKLFYLVFVVFSTVITPPDVISQVCISLNLIIIYEFLLLTKLIRVSMVTS